MHFLRCSKSNFTLVLITANQFIARTNHHLLIHLSDSQTQTHFATYAQTQSATCVRASHTTPPAFSPFPEQPNTTDGLGHLGYHKPQCRAHSGIANNGDKHQWQRWHRTYSSDTAVLETTPILTNTRFFFSPLATQPYNPRPGTEMPGTEIPV